MLVKFCFILCGLFFLEVKSSGEKPKLVDPSTATYLAKVGEKIRLKCNFYDWENGWKMTWYKDGEVISIRRKSRFRMRYGVTSMLRIKNVRIRDAGIYQCVARNKYGTESKQLNLTVTSQLKPRGVPGQGSPWFIKPMPPRQYIAWPLWNHLKLRCAADGEPPLKYQWLKDGKVLTNRRLDPKFNGTKWYLRIQTAVTSDNGRYKCIVSNRLGNISFEYELAVTGLSIRPVLSTHFPVNKTVRVGDNVTFQCIELLGPMLTDFRWLHWKKLPPSYPELNLAKIPSTNSSYYTLIHHRHYKAFDVEIMDGRYGQRVYLNNVTKKDEGMYTCVISNPVGQDIRSAFLRVNETEIHAGKPEFAPDSYVADIGATARLKCAFTDWRVKWVMTWYKRGQILQLTTNGRIQSVVGKSSFLVIEHAQKNDTGIYECVASNEFGTVKRELELTVRG